MVAQADSTLVAIRKKVRRLTASPDASQLSDDDIDEYVNTYYSQDFPASIKTDQLRTVVELFTEPNIDTYTLDINEYQGIRSPIYVEGREGSLYKDRREFFRVWPREASRFTPVSGDGATTVFSWTLGAPFLRNEVLIGSTDIGGNTIQVEDDGNGNLVTAGTSNVLGSVDYVTGAFSITFVTAPAAAEDIVVWVAQYQASRPNSMIFWNDTVTVRPIPDGVYRLEFEAYQTPTQFMATGEAPTLNQYWQLLALGASVKVLQDRQDMEGLENIMPFFEEQHGLVLERQAIEGIGVRNGSIFSERGYGHGSYGPYGGY